MRLLPLFLVGLILVSGRAYAQPEGADETLSEAVREHLRTRIEAERRGLDALDAGGRTVRTSEALIEFYEERRFGPAWIGDRGPIPRIDSLLAVLQRADRHGFRPADYHVDAIQTLHQKIQNRDSQDLGRISDLELLSTDAFLLYASHLLTGRLSPTEITPTWNISSREADLIQKLTEATTGTSIATVLQSLHPPQSEYVRLVEALRRYRRLAASGGWPTVPEGPTLRAGEQGSRVGRVRKRLRVTGDLSSDRSEAPDSFGTSLRDAVVGFQERHGLEPDGAVGPATRAALNVPAAERVQQLIVNMERWRWLPQDLGRRYVLVNIAGFRLRVVEEGDEVLRMSVVTGRPYRQTPVFSGEISYLVLNPYWHVPHSIATKDKLPEIKKDPSYLDRQQFKVFRGWGADAQPIDPSTIDWTRLSQGNFPYRLRQEPGPMNALGRVKFMFPNRYSVYLHDTPTRGLFAQAERAFSSGCVRVERPLELAEYLLADPSTWSRARIQSVIETTNTERSVLLRERVPVHLQYWTAWVEEDGTVHFRNDVYQRDGAVREALRSAPPE